MDQFFLYDRPGPTPDLGRRKDGRDYLILDAQGRAVGIRVDEGEDFKLSYRPTRPLLDDSYTLYIDDFSGHELTSFPAVKDGSYRLSCCVENTLSYGVYRLTVRGGREVTFRGILSVG